MNSQIRNFLIGTGIAALLWSGLLKAQRVEIATIPFDFHVNQTTLPAGEYSITQGPIDGILQLRNTAGGKSILIMPPARDSGNSEPRLVFHRCADHYFLAQIWMPGVPAYTLKQSKLERELAGGQARVTVAYVPMDRR